MTTAPLAPGFRFRDPEKPAPEPPATLPPAKNAVEAEKPTVLNLKSLRKATSSTPSGEVEAPAGNTQRPMEPVSPASPSIRKATLSQATEATNPLLEDDEDEVESVAATYFENPLLEEDDEEERFDALPRQATERQGEGASGVASRRSRFRLTEEDHRLFGFLARCRYASARQIAYLLKTSERGGYRRAERLTAHGFLSSRQESGFPNLYFLTAKGRSFAAEQRKPVRDSFGLGIVRHSLEVNNRMACLLSGLPTELASFDFKHIGEDQLITEPELQSLVYREKVRRGGTLKDDRDGTFADMDRDKRALLAAFKKGEAEAPDGDENLQWCWAIFAGERTYHFPDFVLVKPRGDGGKPLSAAVEVELNVKPHAELVSIMASYKAELDLRGMYRGVIWLAKGRGVQTALEKARDAVGLDNRCAIKQLEKLPDPPAQQARKRASGGGEK